MSRVAVALLLLAAVALAQERPDGTTNWIVDGADVIEPDDRDRINAISKALLEDERVPLFVVTVPEFHGPSIEVFANSLFNAWGIGSPRHNFGMLLVVAIGDRRARIELGAAWGRSGDSDAQRIMDTLIIPSFKSGDFSLGILEGVRGLDAMGRGDSIPAPKRPGWWWPLWIGLALLCVGAVASIMISGDDGWGATLVYALTAAVFGILTLGGSDAEGGGGGSFGGGFSSGGGASGSW